MVDNRTKVVAIGGTAGVAAGVLAAACVFLSIWLYRRRASVAARTRSLESTTVTLRANGAGSTNLKSSVSVSVTSESVADWDHSQPAVKRTAFWGWRGDNNGREPPVSIFGIPKYNYKAAIGGEGKVDWDEILDKNLLVGSIPEEVRILADVAYRCVNRSPRKRPWISEVTQAISRLRQRQLMKHDTLTLPRSETRTVLRRIEYQHVELSDLTSMKELTPIRA